MKKIITLSVIGVAVISLLVAFNSFVLADDQGKADSSNEVDQEDKLKMEQKQKKEPVVSPEDKKRDFEQEETDHFLRVGDYPDPSVNKSNFALHNMHIHANTISLNGSFDNGGRELSEMQILKRVKNIEENANKIKISGNQKAEDQVNAIAELANQLYEDDVKQGDERLQDLHDLVHELNHNFNPNNKVIDSKSNVKGEPIN
ncbi:hypothetical protein [Virgibacillus sp. CBA3643]|uniref:hypothetical protein n=1 Tax=Virgibacillus sp. CBA3643 TaxID=2942278 RepID=UPI0035A2D765